MPELPTVYLTATDSGRILLNFIAWINGTVAHLLAAVGVSAQSVVAVVALFGLVAYFVQ